MKKNGLEKEVVILVLELAVGGELFDFMMYTGAFPEVIARTYFRQVRETVVAMKHIDAAFDGVYIRQTACVECCVPRSARLAGVSVAGGSSQKSFVFEGCWRTCLPARTPCTILV